MVVAGAVGLLYSDGVHSVPPFLWAGSRGVLPPAGPFIFQHHTQAQEALSVEPEELVLGKARLRNPSAAALSTACW